MIHDTPRVDLNGPGYRAMSALSRATHELPLDPRLRELIRVRASMLNGCACCVDMHTKDARAQGRPSSACTRSPPGTRRRSSPRPSVPRWR